MTMDPSKKLNAIIDKVLVPWAPCNLDKIHLFDDLSGTTANDFALRAAFMKHHKDVTGEDVTMANIGKQM